MTYNLHVILRFEMERRLFGGDLAPADLPGAWDELSLQLLGQRPPSAASGVLQDVHWATTAFGYFPSYTLGNLYAASLAATLEAALPAMWEDVERGQFGAILGWLRAEVHQHGHIDDAPDRMRAVVGERDHVADLLDALWRRHGALYGVSRR